MRAVGAEKMSGDLPWKFMIRGVAAPTGDQALVFPAAPELMFRQADTSIFNCDNLQPRCGGKVEASPGRVKHPEFFRSMRSWCRGSRSRSRRSRPTHRVPGFEFGRPGRPAVLSFSVPQKEGWSAERRRGACEAPQPALRRPVHAKIPGPVGFEGGGGPGAWGPCEGPGASRRSNAMPVVGHRILRCLRTPRSTVIVERTKQEHS